MGTSSQRESDLDDEHPVPIAVAKTIALSPATNADVPVGGTPEQRLRTTLSVVSP
jgi:hypothetical protein